MFRFASTAILALATALPATAQQASDIIVPEPETQVTQDFPGLSDAANQALAAKRDGRPVAADDWMVSAAHPLAVEAGARVLRDGGSAADAMVAVQAVLGLVEPQSSGLGGGAFLVWYDAQTGEITTLDARETAPLAADPRYFLDADGEPLNFMTAVVSGRSVGTPGTPRLMEEAHRRWGRANWRGLFDDAIDHAETGFTVSTRMAESVAAAAESLAMFPATADYFLPDGAPVAAGNTLVNPDYADTLRQIAGQGANAFYTGEIAADIVVATRTADHPGLLSMTDLARYTVIERPAVCYEYRGNDVCGMGPPSSGAVAIAQILGMLENFDLGAMDPQDPEARRLMGDATRLAFADRGRYLADSDFVPVPLEGLIDRDYLAARAELLRGDDALPEVSAGEPAWDHALLWGDDLREERPATSHISIVDRDGNVLSMTTTIESGFGARIFVRGLLLNNELTDFSFRTHADGWPIANRVEPGKRPRSSMSPTIVLRDGEPVLAIGSPGGATIIGYTAQAIIAHLDWGMDVQQAAMMPHLVNSFGTYQIEAGTWAEELVAPLSDLGFQTNVTALTSGLHAISLGDQLLGGADPRREGIALGE
ncbi:gamma-glutamyltransferase [Roseinatronobacter alkalisoli]|uniref:Glutathione hydrolase proenzyme n=1 Tax=Roseinatronobacter alkalisoli TaxID=3028235 RepID=A0ABT5T7C3_9RHOB|nr:gamma-glutamyltransferase [Roseinatronobacter sp. HJB301]MDD7971017.1 gamma-glutamyltransferase [Roseinatronobacter sp. HJB301]